MIFVACRRIIQTGAFCEEGCFRKIGYLCSIESFQIRFNYMVFFMRVHMNVCVNVFIDVIVAIQGLIVIVRLHFHRGRTEIKWNRDFIFCCEMKLLNVWKSWVLIINFELKIHFVRDGTASPLFETEIAFFNFQFEAFQAN